ncbi:MAG: sugar transferase [Acidobacteria bacterium]|nr:sugar transferase [Acidobacteriota bacterium]
MSAPETIRLAALLPVTGFDMFTRRARLLWLLLIISELIFVALSFEIAYLLRSALPGLTLFFLTPGTVAALLAISAILWAATGLPIGVYRGPENFDIPRTIRRTFTQTFWFSLLFAAAIYLLKLGEISRAFVAIFILLNMVFQAAYRLSAHKMREFLLRGFTDHCYYLIVGTGKTAAEVAHLIEKNKNQGDRVIGFLREQEGKQLEDESLRERYPVSDLSELHRMLEDHIVDEVLFAVSKARLEKMEDLFLTCEEQGVKTRVLLDFFPHFHSEITLDRLEHLPLLTFSNAPENEYLLFLKRAFDFMFSAVLLTIGAPLLLLIAVFLKLTSPGPVIYRQMRCGLNGRKFWLYKFRSMYLDAEQDQQLLSHMNEMDGPVFKISRDPRVTSMGRFLRKTSLDELPQLFNILKGEMSFVGPRPPLPEEVTLYERWQRRRLRMKPGLTCLWALEGRSELTFARWMKLDMDYIDHWSLALDFKILLRTIPRVLSGRGAS